jgi:hypothetical protein
MSIFIYRYWWINQYLRSALFCRSVIIGCSLWASSIRQTRLLETLVNLVSNNISSWYQAYVWNINMSKQFVWTLKTMNWKVMSKQFVWTLKTMNWKVSLFLIMYVKLCNVLRCYSMLNAFRTTSEQRPWFASILRLVINYKFKLDISWN